MASHDPPGNARCILVTGGAGYIGSHTCVQLLERGFSVVIVDNLSCSSRIAIQRIEEVARRNVVFYEVDITRNDSLERVFSKHSFDAVIHCAGLKSVGESVSMPLEYYLNNVAGSITLLAVMKKYGCSRIVLSSSAAVYGFDAPTPVNEDAPKNPVNPYGRSKLMIEQILADFASTTDKFCAVVLRYFNPIGAHPSGMLGEDPGTETPNNLLPNICNVAIGRSPHFTIFGDDFSTRDGTGLRDYIHVVDLASGHLVALEQGVFGSIVPGVHTFNLGDGRGTTVLELLKYMECAVGRTIPYKIGGRRAGDVDSIISDANRIKDLLGWAPALSTFQACMDAWRWQQANPLGYRLTEGRGEQGDHSSNGADTSNLLCPTVKALGTSISRESV